MEKITKYKANDGVEFMSSAECTAHELNCYEALQVMSELSDRPDGCDFINGSGFLQHDKDSVLVARNKLLELCKRFTDHKWIQETIDGGFKVDASWAGRVIGETAPNTIYRMWNRFSCIDDQCREWGQPYYALNPQKATQKQLN